MNQIKEFQVKTKCSSDAGTNNDIKFVLCQSGKCCSIQGLPATLGNPDCKKIESFENSQLGDCATMNFDYSEITGSISYADPTNWSDRYIGEYIKITLHNGDFHRCPIDGRIDGDQGGPPERDISCESFNSNKGIIHKIMSANVNKIPGAASTCTICLSLPVFCLPSLF